MAIGIRVTKGITDEGGSRFFGAPAIPGEWEKDFGEDVIFFCQIRLSDIADLDTEHRLPHSGYLFIFLDTADFPYQPIVHFFNGEPDTLIDGFNDIAEEFAALTEGWEMTFSAADDDSEGIRLFGNPNGWEYGEAPPKLLMQFDPLASDMPFLSEVDGYMFIFETADGYAMQIDRL